MESKTYNVPNISCGHCVMNIERQLMELEGVNGIDANAEAKTLTVMWKTPATEDRIRSLLEEINYPVAE
jgi:copper chaperone CopZ